MQAMNPLPDHFEPNPWLTFARRGLRRLAVAAILLVVGALALELVAYHFFPTRSTRFLLEGESDGTPAWIDNQFFPYRFASARTAQAPVPIVALKSPAPGTLRVCLLGGSEAMGVPDASFGLARQLELMLQSRYPGHPVEVINMALPVGNSHVLREVARDLAPLRPNAVVVLTGNDEVAGPYGPAAGLGQFHRSSRIARMMVLFSRTRLSQLCIAAILRDAAAASPVVIACTVPVNLRDCAPFSTSFLEDETAAQEVREKLRAALAAEAATNRTDAARLFSDIIRRDPTHAEALFRAARMALRENHTAEAAALFARARDADALRLRADSRINALIRDSAADNAVSLLDAEALFAIRSPQGIPGRELFLDHVHFTFEATHLLASALLDRMEFLRAFEPEPAGSIPSPEAMASELLYTPWGRAAELDSLIGQYLRPPHRRQLDNAETLVRLKDEQLQWQARVAAISPENTRAIFARRQASRPADAWIAARAAWYLLNADDPVRAEAAAKTALAHWPHRFDIRALLAYTHARVDADVDGDIALIRGPDGADSGYYDINLAIAIGRELLEKKRVDVAKPWFEHALRRDPWNSEAAIGLAEVLHRQDRRAEAIETLQAAIERNPDNPLLWENIASIYCLVGDWETANECFRKSEEIAPYRYERLLKWADALVRLKQYARARRPINNYVAAMPEDPEGLALQAQVLANLAAKGEPAAEEDEQKPSRKFPWE